MKQLKRNDNANLLTAVLVLAAGLALPQIVSGTFTGKAFVISLTSLGLATGAVRTGVAGLKWVYELRKGRTATAAAR